MRHRIILLVEDSPDDTSLTLLALRQANILNEVVVASDGAEALDLLLGERQLRPAVILLDLHMPKVGGLEMLKRLRANADTRLIPVVILTSSKKEADVISGYDLGANSYVHKPVDFDQFADAVRDLGLYWLALNESPPEQAKERAANPELPPPPQNHGAKK